jgi:hypothetical protein
MGRLWLMPSKEVRTGNGGELLTLVSDFDTRCGNLKVIDFHDINSRVRLIPAVLPFVVGQNVSVTASGPLAPDNFNVVGFVGPGGWSLSSNGKWRSDTNGRGGFAALDFDDGFIDFEFQDELKCCVGGFINYAPGSEEGAKYEVKDDDDNVLSTFEHEADAPINGDIGDENVEEFRGIFRSACDIHKFRISNGRQVLDMLTFSGRACPLCKDHDDKDGFVIVSGEVLGICVKKCVAEDDLPTMREKGFECGLCD